MVIFALFFCLVYAEIDLLTGPTAILSLLIQRYVAENIEFAIFLAFINGALIFLLGMLNLGFLVQFISVPVCKMTQLSILIIPLNSSLHHLSASLSLSLLNGVGDGRFYDCRSIDHWK